MAEVLLGKPVADAIAEEVRTRAEALAAKGRMPCLAIIRVGAREEDLSYERGALKRAGSAGIAVRRFELDAEAPQEEILDVVRQVNEDASIHGCLLFRPLPAGVDEAAVCDALSPVKDVDGITSASLASVFMDGDCGFAPCTAEACVRLLEHYGIPLEGARVAVVGRSLVIGKPVAMMLLARNATVTVAHSRTANLPGLCRSQDIVITAVGRAKMFVEEHFREGQTVVDVGINMDADGALCGDVDFDAAEPVVRALTPVPRGVGSITTAVLMDHVVSAAERA